jgi:hypothetical protein
MMHPRRYALVLATLPGVFGTLGCYAYLPARDANALVGRRLSISLTDSGSVVLASRVGASVVGMEGTYMGDSAGSHLMSVLLTRQRSGAESDWKGEHVSIPRALVVSVEEREFSPSRTAFAGVLAAAGAFAATVAFRGKGEGGQGAPVPGSRPGQ